MAKLLYYIEQGIPIEAVNLYLATITNSNFEGWLDQNPTAKIEDFKLSFDKFSLDGALFDLEKINNISKDVIFKTPIETLVNNVKYNKAGYKITSRIISYVNPLQNILGIIHAICNMITIGHK